MHRAVRSPVKSGGRRQTHLAKDEYARLRSCSRHKSRSRSRERERGDFQQRTRSPGPGARSRDEHIKLDFLVVAIMRQTESGLLRGGQLRDSFLKQAR